VTGPHDLASVHQEQDALKLSPLAAGNSSAPCRGPAILRGDPWNYFAVVDDALTENPPPARDAAVLARIAAIDIGPGRHFDALRFDEAARQALLAGITDAKQQVAAANVNGKVVNGWAYPAPGVGNFGADYLLRAATALKGLAALQPVEATYLSYIGEPVLYRRTSRRRSQLSPPLRSRRASAGECLLVAFGLRDHARQAAVLCRKSDPPLLDRRQNTGPATQPGWRIGYSDPARPRRPLGGEQLAAGPRRPVCADPARLPAAIGIAGRLLRAAARRAPALNTTACRPCSRIQPPQTRRDTHR
jgi:hypothetical protein